MHPIQNEQLQALLGAPQAQKLLQQLKNDGGQRFEAAVHAAKAGDYVKAQQLLQPLLTPEAQSQAEALRKSLG